MIPSPEASPGDVRLVPVARGSAGTTLSFAQQRLWVVDRLVGDAAAYNMTAYWRIRGPLALTALQSGLDALVARHESLRTRVVVRDGAPVQVIDPPGPVVVGFTDLGTLSPAAREARARELGEAEARQPFDLAATPPLRVHVLRHTAEEHDLLLTWHHIASDGWSAGVFHRELGMAYDAVVTGRELQWAPLPVQYADYAVWQRAWLEGHRLESQLAYWRETLAGISALELPTDQPRPAIASYKGAQMVTVLPRALMESVTRLGLRERATPFMTLLAAFAVLLSRYSGQDDITVGTPIAGRRRPELEGLIGFFANTVVLRADLSGQPTFRELLARVREGAIGAFDHQDVPFEKVVEDLAPARDLGRQPLFQTLFGLQNMPGAPLALRGATTERWHPEVHSAKFDLSLLIRKVNEEWRASWEYATDLFEAGTIARMATHFQTLLEGLVAAPDAPVTQRPLLPAAERDQLLVTWNDTAASYPEGGIHHLVDAQAARTPTAVAVACGTEHLTYAALQARANQLAHRLVALGVGPEVPVALCAARSLELVVGLLAILKAGGAYVPLDPSYPPDRLALLLADTGAAVLLTQAALLDRLPAFAGPRLCLDQPDPRLAAAPTTAPDVAVTAQTLAYVIYTSGSTGTPKGILLPHATLLNLLTWHRARPSAGRVAQFTAIGFDVSVQEIFTALVAGHTLVVADDETRLDPARFAAFLAAEAITDLFVPNVVLQYLAQAVQRDGRRLPHLAHIYQAGEVLTLTPALRAFCAAHPACRLHNHYGPAETHVVTADTLPADVQAWPSTASIGRPIANTRVYLLDPHGTPVPVGVPGEVYLGGAGLARGYLGRPDLTRERFVADPFSAAPEARLYRTGDRARYRPDGRLEFLGRFDDQIKIRGVRVEPGEVQAVLAAHPAVRQAVVVAREDAAGAPRLVAYVIPIDAATAEVASLRAFLRQRLPEALCPAAFVLLDHLPLTPTGKIDRRALPPPAQSDVSASDYVPPRDAFEDVITEVWRELLGDVRIGAHDNFFDLGGHSLLATQILARVARFLQVDVPLRAFFETPTVEALADLARRALATGAPEDIPAIAPAPGRREASLSFAQQRLWFLDRLLPEKSAYNIPSAWRLLGPVDVKALHAGLDSLVARHESLRTRIDARTGDPIQIVDAPMTLALPVTDLSALPPVEREARAEEMTAQEAERPFDLASGPMIRAQLLRLEPEEHRLLLTVHHIASDGWSMGVLHQEMAEAYAAAMAGKAPAWSALPVQYADYAVWQRAWLQGDRLETQLAYWREALAGVTPLTLPTDKPRPAIASYRGRVLMELLPSPVVSAATALARTEGATPFMALVAAFAVLLSRYSGQDDITVGTPIAGRRRPELEGLIGFFANTVVLRADLSGQPTFRELLARVRERALGAYTHQDVPFEKLVEELAPTRDQGRQPLFQTLFVVQNTPGDALALRGLTTERLAINGRTAKFDLSVSMRETPEGWRARWEYATDLFEAGTIARMATHFQTLLEGLVAAPDAPVTQRPLLPAAERDQLLVTWNDTAASYPEGGIHHLVDAQAARTPTAVAVACGTEHLTYAALQARANQLAHRLVALGVGPEVPVALCAARSLELVVGLLAILKAGGAYVPLDPSYPPDRLALLLADTGAAVLLTQAALLDRLPAFAGPRLCLDQPDPRLAAAPTTAPDVAVTAQTLAYVIYTSGSTGTPKGILLPHATLLNLLTWHRARPSAGRVAQFTAIGFDVSVQEIFTALVAGHTLVVADDETRLDPARFAAFLAAEAITDLFVPNVVLQYLAQAVQRDGRRLPHLAHIYQAGEVLTLTPALRAFCAAHPACRLHNHYGPAETHVVTADTLPADVQAWPSTASIGRPIANTRVYLLDPHGTPVPVGVPGEVYLGGAGLARGYLGRPDLTRERFVADPFSAAPEARLYRTGDRARYRPDGRLEFLGRFDDQIKIRGVRVEPGEVQAVLAAHPAVRQAVVVAREDAAGAPRLVAYVIPIDAATAEVASLRAFLRQRLPEALCPAAFVLLDHLPLTPTGKIDRRALPPPAQSDEPRHENEVPVGEVEIALAEIWAEILQLDSVGRHDNFFDLGGHSMLAVALTETLRQRTGADVPVGVVFESPTVATLADRLATEPVVGSIGQPAVGADRRPLLRLRTPGSGNAAHLSIDEILTKQREWVKLWKGTRPGPESLIRTLNESGRQPGLFWCLQGHQELTALAEHLGPRQPVHGMRSGYQIMKYSAENVRVLAEYYAAEMIAAQPQGPFLLGGNCQGGWIAEAIAKRIREMGRTVSLLILLEKRPFTPYDGPVALIFGRDSHFNPYTAGANPDVEFRRAYAGGFTVDIIKGAHGKFFEPPNVQTLATAVGRRLAHASNNDGSRRPFGRSTLTSLKRRWLARF